jgi:hypothetical protein
MDVNDITRRKAMMLLGASSAALFAPGFMLPAVAQVDIGEGSVTTVSDGNLVLPLDFVYPDAPRDELITLLEDAGLPTTQLEPACNVTVYGTGTGSLCSMSARGRISCRAPANS